jgi:hypothetical protein
VASYYVTLFSNPNYVSSNTNADVVTAKEVIQGSRGSILKFKLKASTDLQTSTYWFTRLGGTVTTETVACRYIDTFVRVTGQRTGYSVDIPVRFLKKV